MTKYAVVFWLIAAMLAVPLGTSAMAQDSQVPISDESGTTPGYMTVDALLMRPFGLGAILIGSVAFVVALPFSAATGGTRDAYEMLIKSPVDYTFKRPLGYF
ncbi:hypothetical protein [Desulfonema ishimotonii]|nr:hypothetical protein [Desulfonema ishimotonii]